MRSNLEGDHSAGVTLGVLLSQGPGWRWVLFVNLPVVAFSLLATFQLLPGQSKRAQLGDFDLQGALLATGGVLLLVFALVRAPVVGWGAPQTILELAGAAAVLGAFAVNERRATNPLFPFSILRVKVSSPPTSPSWSHSPAFWPCSSSSPSTCKKCCTTHR
jgi:hypothetical protein